MPVDTDRWRWSRDCPVRRWVIPAQQWPFSSLNMHRMSQPEEEYDSHDMQYPPTGFEQSKLIHIASTRDYRARIRTQSLQRVSSTSLDWDNATTPPSWCGLGHNHIIRDR